VRQFRIGCATTSPPGDARRAAAPVKQGMSSLHQQLAATSFRLRRRAIHGFFTAVARAGELAARWRRPEDPVEVIRDVAYGWHPVAHRLDIYRPRYAPRPLPVLLYIHGGAFVLCSKETHASIAQVNAEEAGFLVFNINYRLAPNHPYPAAIADACAAYRWVVENCARYGGDRSRIVVAGESAGGNLALGVGVAACYRRPEDYARRVFDTGVVPVGLMPLMPYLQASDPLRHTGQPGIGYFSLSVVKDIAMAYLGAHAPASEATLMADPVRVLEECGAPARTFPQVFSGVGTADLCCADVRRLEAACRALGLPIATHYFENEVHAFHALRWRDAARRFWHESLEFLRAMAAAPLPVPRRRRRRSSAQARTPGYAARTTLPVLRRSSM
jgi:acetyl esterase